MRILTEIRGIKYHFPNNHARHTCVRDPKICTDNITVVPKGDITHLVPKIYHVLWHLYYTGNKTLPHGPLTRYLKLRVAHAPGIPGTFSPPPQVCDPNMHHGTCVTHVACCIPRSLTRGFLWSRWRGKCSRHSWRMWNPQFYISGKRSMVLISHTGLIVSWHS